MYFAESSPGAKGLAPSIASYPPPAWKCSLYVLSVSRIASRVSRTALISAGTAGGLGYLGGAAAGGSAAAQVAHGGAQLALAGMAAKSAGQNLGEASVDFETGHAGRGTLKTALGVLDVVSAASGARTGVRDLYAGTRAATAFRGVSAAPVGVPGVCFSAGTPIRTSDGFRAIEQLTVGDRVLTTDGQDESTEIDPATWRKVTLKMPNPEYPADILDIVLLRSQEWIEMTGAREGALIWFDLDEMGLHGAAEVVGVEACPSLTEGQGRVVLATVTHLNSFVMDVRLKDTQEVLHPTDRHLLFSETRQDWIPAAQLVAGETLATRTGTVVVESVMRKAGTERVYNIEVETEHCYYAGQSQVLSHNVNPCAQPGAAPVAKKPYSSNRPPYGKGQVDDVWQNAKQVDGKVYDPHTGEKLVWDRTKPRNGQWDMGHQGRTYKELHKDYMADKITKREFLREYRDPKNYAPQSVNGNRSRRYD